MSKDKYRPSTADFEVTETGHARVRITQGAGSAGISAPTPPRQGADTPSGSGEYEQPREEFRENWYPENLKVVNQEVWYHNDGRMRVNVTFGWDELSDADIYFMRVTPA